MKKVQENSERRAMVRYVSPTAKSFTLVSGGLLCMSERQIEMNVTEMDEGDDNW